MERSNGTACCRAAAHKQYGDLLLLLLYGLSHLSSCHIPIRSVQRRSIGFHHHRTATVHNLTLATTTTLIQPPHLCTAQHSNHFISASNIASLTHSIRTVRLLHHLIHPSRHPSIRSSLTRSPVHPSSSSIHRSARRNRITFLFRLITAALVPLFSPASPLLSLLFALCRCTPSTKRLQSVRRLSVTVAISSLVSVQRASFQPFEASIAVRPCVSC